MRGQWIAQPEGPREHQCAPLSWDEVIEERLPPRVNSDLTFIWECPEPDCKRWWKYLGRNSNNRHACLELEVHWSLATGSGESITVTSDATNKATWIEPNKYSDGW